MNLLSERAKYRLRLAAKFLRRAGLNFDGGNFYQRVIEVIGGLDELRRTALRGYVDWVEEYEISEARLYDDPTRSRARKSKKANKQKGASH